MHRWVVLLALAACAPTAAEDASGHVRRERDEPTTWVYPPPVGLPLGAVHGRLGRGQTPQPIVELGIASAGGPEAAAGRGPLRQPTVWPIPGDGPARAAIYGSEDDHTAIDLIDIDRGRVVWRDTTACAAPIVAAAAGVIVCADLVGTRAVGLDGALRWSTPSAFVAATEGRIAVSAAGELVVLAAATGDELSRLTLPRGVAATAIAASCGDGGRELFAVTAGSWLQRISDGKAGPQVAWSVALGPAVLVRVIDACDHATIVVSVAGAAGSSLVAVDRETGALAGQIDGALGWWAARDGTDRLEIATGLGIASYAYDLAGEPVPVVPVGVPLHELVAARGDRRLVRASPRTAVLLDRAGVRGYLPLAATSVALGDTSLLAAGIATEAGGAGLASSAGADPPRSSGETVHRFALPPRWARHLRPPPRGAGIALDAELRDLPPVLPLEAGAAIALPDTGMYAVTGHAIDPSDGAAVYAIAVDRDGERAAVARADLAAKQWRWQRVDGCGPGAPVAIAVAREVVVCGASGTGTALASVRATSRDGVARWAWSAETLDAVTAGGDAIIVHHAGRITVLDARDGRTLGHVASDDGAAVRAAIVVLDGKQQANADGRERGPGRIAGATLVITAEHGRVVARLGVGGLLPVWSVAVAGVVRALATAGEGVLVVLEDGDAYRIDARTRAVIGLPGVGLTWRAAADVVTGDTLGGPIPGVVPPPAPPPRLPVPTPPQVARRPLPIERGEIIPPPPMSTPIPPPPPLGDSWQLTLYERTGGLRARNDYALDAPIAPPVAGGTAGSPLVIAYGPGLREVVVIDSRTGDPLRRVQLPDDAPPGAVFGTVVDGAPVAGALLASPLRVVVF